MNSKYAFAAGFLFLLALSVSPLMSFGQSTEDVFEAIQRSDYNQLNDLVLAGADLNQGNEFGFTPLMAASKIGDHKIVGYILSANPDVNWQSQTGATALMIAAKYGHKHVVEQLLERGADPLIRNNSNLKASRFAYAYQHPEVYRILEEAERVLERS